MRGERNVFLSSLQTLLAGETFYRQYATPDSSVQGRRGPTAAHFQFSESIPVGRLVVFAARQLRCFLGLLLTEQNSVYFSKAVQRRVRGGGDLLTSPCPRHRWKLNLTHLCAPYMFLSCLHKTSTAAWETGSPRPSDNLSLHRIMTECFPITPACCCFRVSS